MKKKITIAIVCIVALLCMAGNASAAAGVASSPDIPSSVQIMKDNDVSASFLSNLLGPSWKVIAGDAAADDLGGMQRYHGLLVGFLGMLNALAMLFISAAILYHWGIFAVNRAHKGERGDGTFNTLWTPVRHAFSFSLAVPVLNGLSLLQVMILGCVSFSINVANLTWDWAGDYIINHSQSGIVDNSSPLIEDESLMLIQPMFQAVLISEYLWALSDSEGTNENVNDTIKARELPDRVTPYNLREYKSVEIIDDRYVVEREPLDGAITFYVMPGRGMPLGQLGKVTFNTVKRNYDKKNGQLVPLGEDGVALEAIAESRVAALVWASDQLRIAARAYIQERGVYQYGSGEMYKVTYEYLNGLEIARKYRQIINATTEAWVEAIKEANNTKALLEKALDSRDGESSLGWTSAGLFSSALAHRQREIDGLIYGSSSRFEYPKADDLDQGVVGDIARFFGSKNTARKFAEGVLPMFNAAPLWAVDRLLGGRIYAEKDEEGEGAGLINKTLASMFLDGTGANGLVATTLSKLRSYDPIVVLSDFGDKMWNLAGWLAVGAGVAGLAGIGTGVITSAMFGSFSVAATLKIAPLTIVSIWCYVILHWIVRVLEALVAAPFWAAVHLLPEGTGFAGTHARKGYLLLLDIVSRPPLVVVGACTCVAVWIGAAHLFSMLFSSYLNGYTAYNGAGLVWEIVMVSFLLIFFFVLYTKLWILMVSGLPDRINNWIGGGAGGMGGEEASGVAPAAASGVAAAKGASMLGGAATGAASGAKGLYDKYKEKQEKDKNKGGGGGDSPAPMAEKTE